MTPHKNLWSYEYTSHNIEKDSKYSYYLPYFFSGILCQATGRLYLPSKCYAYKTLEIFIFNKLQQYDNAVVHEYNVALQFTLRYFFSDSLKSFQYFSLL